MLQELRQRVGRWWCSVATRTSTATPRSSKENAAAPESVCDCASGLRLLGESKPAEALACFEVVLDAAPRYAEAHHCMGLALRALGKHEEALARFQRAVEIEPDHVPALTHQGMLCFELGRRDDAQDCFKLVLAFDSGHVAAHLGLAEIYALEAREPEAIEHLERAAGLDPRSPVPLIRLGALQQRLGQDAAALTSLERAAALAPPPAELLYNLGALCLKLERPREAAEHLARAVARRSDFPEAHLNLGNAVLACGNAEEAVKSYLRAIELRPDYAEAHHNLGNAHRLRSDAANALAAYQTALLLKPDYAEAQLQIGVVLYDQGRIEDAIACYHKALALRPEFPEARLNLGLARLALGDFERGWAGYEWRFRQTAKDNRVIKRSFRCEEWQGQSLTGKNILIWGEQGISDQLQFAGMFGEMAEAADRCTIECAPKLVPLLSRSLPAAQVVPLTDPPHPATQRGIDFHIAAGSAARWLRPSLGSFPQRAHYLVADKARAGYWRRRLTELGPGLKVGFSWRSGNLSGIRTLFSSRLEEWSALFDVSDVQWVCLQYDDCKAELDAAQRLSGVKLHRFAEVNYFDDLDEVSALMTALDLVLSAPTAVSVQAAALGVEVWQMNYGVDWQGHGTAANPWFPTLSRFERRPEQCWGEIIAAIAPRLEARVRR